MLGYAGRAHGGLCFPRLHELETRLTLTDTPDPHDAARPDADETSDAGTEPEDEPTESGVGQAIGGVRAAFMRMLDAHVTLLRAELEVFGKEIGIIAGLAVGALVLLILVGILLYVGSFLFFGEWLFGSMGWGIIHGTLVGAAFISFVGVDLAGGEIRRYGWGAVIGLVAGVAVAALLLSNAGNESGRWLADLVAEQSNDDLPFGDEWLVTLAGLVVGAIIATIAALIGGWRAKLHGRVFAGVVVAALVLGGFVGALYVSTRYSAADGVLGLAIMIGLLTWIMAGILLAARAGFDPEARYANLIPRESIAAFGKTKEFLTEEFDRQKNRMMRR